jgi:hypothetical protein
MWLGAGDPAKTIDRMREIDPVLRDLKIVLSAWFGEFGLTRTTAREAIKAANETRNDDLVRPGLQDALLTVAGRAGHINARVLGKWLLKHAGRVVDVAGHGELPLPLAFEAAGDRQGVVLWRIAERGV